MGVRPTWATQDPVSAKRRTERTRRKKRRKGRRVTRDNGSLLSEIPHVPSLLSVTVL